MEHAHALAPPPSAKARLRAFVGGRWILAFLLLETLYFCLTADGFASPSSAQILLFYGVEIFLLAVAELFVIITGGIDLSLGYVLGFASIVATEVIEGLARAGMPEAGALAVGAVATLLVGVVPGLVNGWLVAYLDVPPFIATFSMLGVCHGISELVIGGVYAMGLPQLAADVGSGHLLYVAPGGVVSFFRRPEVERGAEVLELVPVVVVVAAAVIALLAFVLARTRFGRHLYALGGNRDAALRAGIPVRRRLLGVYALSSLLASLAGLVYTLKYVSGKADAGASSLLDSIAAVMIGGASMFGGSGTVGRTLVGCLVIAVLELGLRMKGTPTFDKYILVGAILVLAVVAERYLSPDRKK
ncbi:MAG TPA: ABC transporter permease [Anaeromyxobacteraceae bacterium]|nr:ABC transporter permease [Anaeromyxobacteraceae bacterium]